MIIDIIIIKEAGVQDGAKNHRLQEGAKTFFQAGNHEHHLQEDQCQDHAHAHRQDMILLIKAKRRLKDYLTELYLEAEAKVKEEGIAR